MLSIYIAVNDSLGWLINVSGLILSVTTSQRPSIFEKKMNEEMPAASVLLVHWSVLSTFVQLSSVKPTQVCSAPAGRQVNSTTLAAPEREFIPQFCLRKGRQITRKKRSGSQFHYIASLTL
jgi:hypothetical protein